MTRMVAFEADVDGQAYELGYDLDDVAEISIPTTPAHPEDRLILTFKPGKRPLWAPKAATTGGRDLRDCVDRFGNIGADVMIGGGPCAAEEWPTGASAPPATVAAFLRDLADDVARAGQPATP